MSKRTAFIFKMTNGIKVNNTEQNVEFTTVNELFTRINSIFTDLDSSHTICVIDASNVDCLTDDEIEFVEQNNTITYYNDWM